MKPKPDALASDIEAMRPYWRLVDAIMGGAAAMRAEADFLPKFPDETAKNYEFRRQNAKFTNVFQDIVENLAQRPFAKDVVVDDGAPEPIKTFAEDVDACGNNLHVFAGEVFMAGIAAGLDLILVDHTRGVRENATVAEERAAGVRPYWVRYPASSLLAAYSAMIDGKEQFVHVRLHEPAVERDGWGEKTFNRVRILNREPLDGGGFGPATYEVWEERRATQGADVSEWVLIEGPAPLSIGVIPLVPFLTGRRAGRSWRFKPPMQGAADLQVELYQQESALKNAKALTAFPMLAGNGVAPEEGDDGQPIDVRVGPHAVLYAPPGDGDSGGTWSFIEPSATSLRFLADDIEATIRQLRELGRQPLTAQSGNLTVVTTAVAAEKGNAAIQAWALQLADALAVALDYTARWLKIDGGDNLRVQINTDFDLGMGDDETFTHVLALRASGEISRDAALHEAKRRGILDADYDPDEDAALLLNDMESDPTPPPPQAFPPRMAAVGP